MRSGGFNGLNGTKLGNDSMMDLFQKISIRCELLIVGSLAWSPLQSMNVVVLLKYHI